MIARLDVEATASGVAGAVEVFLEDVELDAGDDVLAATARVLGSKLDAVRHRSRRRRRRRSEARS